MTKEGAAKMSENSVLLSGEEDERLRNGAAPVLVENSIRVGVLLLLLCVGEYMGLKLLWCGSNYVSGVIVFASLRPGVGSDANVPADGNFVGSNPGETIFFLVFLPCSVAEGARACICCMCQIGEK